MPRKYCSEHLVRLLIYIYIYYVIRSRGLSNDTNLNKNGVSLFYHPVNNKPNGFTLGVDVFITNLKVTEMLPEIGMAMIGYLNEQPLLIQVLI